MRTWARLTSCSLRKQMAAEFDFDNVEFVIGGADERAREEERVEEERLAEVRAAEEAAAAAKRERKERRGSGKAKNAKRR